MTDAERSDPSRFVRPRYAFPKHKIAERYATMWPHDWVIAWRDIARSTDERTFIATVVPSLAVAHTAWLLIAREQHARQLGLLLANFNSFVFDYVARQKAGGTHIAAFVVDQLPVLAPSIYATDAKWSRGTKLRDWLLPRVLELTFTAWDLEPFARDVGHEGPPFRWDADRRFLLRCELDAAFFHLYELAREDVAYVMDSFPIVRRDDEKAYDGMFRTRDTILDIFDAMAEAVRLGVPYQTRLAPPPADPRVAHPQREGGKVLPFRLAVHPQPAIQPAGVASDAPRRDLPAWSPDLLAVVATKTGLAASGGRWGTTLTGVDLGIAALAAVLRNIGGPASRDEVERAVVLSVLPSLLHPKFDTQTAPQWRRAIGTANMNVTSIAALSIPWAEVLRRAAVEHLLGTDADGRWRAGADIDDAPSDALDARALVSLSWLESVSGAPVEDAILVTQLRVLRVA
ncbi:MAG: hypothetical protein JST00_38920 [Deltaproteobacteria bacterium]|nr:hypothetical protein [Deltaproteobacteria bacterium]